MARGCVDFEDKGADSCLIDRFGDKICPHLSKLEYLHNKSSYLHSIFSSLRVYVYLFMKARVVDFTRARGSSVGPFAVLPLLGGSISTT